MRRCKDETLRLFTASDLLDRPTTLTPEVLPIWEPKSEAPLRGGLERGAEAPLHDVSHYEQRVLCGQGASGRAYEVKEQFWAMGSS